jgi:hypothetical protein
MFLFLAIKFVFSRGKNFFAEKVCIFNFTVKIITNISTLQYHRYYMEPFGVKVGNMKIN